MTGLDETTVVRALLADRAKLLSYVWVIVRDSRLAEDVYQEVATLAIQKCRELRDEAALPTWLRRTARFQALAAIRDKSRERTQPLTPEILDQLDAWWSARDEVAEDPRIPALLHCLSQLTPYALEIVALRYRLRLSGEQVAERLGRNLRTTYWRSREFTTPCENASKRKFPWTLKVIPDMSPEHPRDAWFEDLVVRYLDNQLAPDELEEFQHLLASSPERCFTLAEWAHRAVLIQEYGHALFPDLPGDHSLQQGPDPRSVAGSVAGPVDGSRIQPEHQRGWRRIRSMQPGRSWRRIGAAGRWMAVVAMTVIAALTVAVGLLVPRIDWGAPEFGTGRTAIRIFVERGVARFTYEVTRCTWEAGLVPKIGEPLYPGRYRLVEGTALFLFERGAEVLLDGPAESVVARHDRPESAADVSDQLAFVVLWYHRPENRACLQLRYGMDLHGVQVNPPGYQGAFQVDADGQGYTLEYAIPWHLLHAAADPPRAGDQLAAMWLAHWSDADGGTWQGQLQEIRNPGDEGWNFDRATTWGRALYHPR